jgi:hypothetical protein
LGERSDGVFPALRAPRLGITPATVAAAQNGNHRHAD